MDMLAELIMLRNQREQRVAEQEALRGEMVRCCYKIAANSRSASAICSDATHQTR